MKLGAEPKKIGILVGLVVVAGIVYWINSSPSGAPSTSSAPRPAADVAGSVVTAQPVADGITQAMKRRQPSGRYNAIENVYKVPGSIDPSKVDPTLRLDLLTKVQSIDVEGGARDLFQFSKEPPPPVVASKGPIPVVPNLHPNDLPKPVATTPQPPPPPPPAPQINLKYYGYSTKRTDGEKKAFFLDGEDIIVASEGEIIKKQYKVVRIGNTSVQMEDTTSKTTQTLPIQPDAAPV